MNFAKKPTNDFPEFIEAYFRRCRERVPMIEANAGKWTLEDLIPGLSDFDTRFLVNDSMTAKDWCHMSMEVGRVHLELAQERKDWARNLEHLPGVNLRWDELFDEQLYFTEFSQWSFHHGDRKRIEAARNYVSHHAWTPTDELYHWKKIAIYYGPYNRTIDPPVNLGAYENKYSLHSRLMHYMAPPVHSAVCLIERKSSPGKLDAFRKARGLFPNPKTIDLILSLVDRHYEKPKFLTEPGVTELDRELDAYLTGMVNVIRDRTGFPCPPDATVPQLKAAVKAASGDVSFAQLFENIKFSRLMKGRLWFYAHNILWFDSLFLIRNELNRIRSNFYETPLRLFAKLAYRKDVTAEEALEIMTGDVFDREQVEACRRFAAATLPGCPDSDLKKRALEIAATFDPFLCAMERLVDHAKARLASKGMNDER